jgi:hypothetical protein
MWPLFCKNKRKYYINGRRNVFNRKRYDKKFFDNARAIHWFKKTWLKACNLYIMEFGSSYEGSLSECDETLFSSIASDSFVYAIDESIETSFSKSDMESSYELSEDLKSLSEISLASSKSEI